MPAAQYTFVAGAAMPAERAMLAITPPYLYTPHTLMDAAMRIIDTPPLFTLIHNTMSA